VQEFSGAGVPETYARRLELLDKINQYRLGKGLPNRSMSSLLAKLARVDKANNGAQLLPGALNTEEAILSVEDSGRSVDYELRQLTEKRKLEEDRMAISMKNTSTWKLESLNFCVGRQKTRVLLSSCRRSRHWKRLCESQRSYKLPISCCEIAIHCVQNAMMIFFIVSIPCGSIKRGT